MLRSPHRKLAALSLVVAMGLAVSCLEREGPPATPGGTGGGTGGGTPGTGGGTPGTGATGGTVTPGTGATGGTVTPLDPNDPTCQDSPALRANYLSPEDPSVAAYLAGMTVDEKINLLSGGPVCPNYDCDFDGTGVPSQGINDFIMRDGPRGVRVMSGAVSSTWAVAVSRAASFDLDLEYRVGVAHAQEMQAYKIELMLAPTINTLRHPGWARAQETYGEDPVLLGKMGAAFTRGLQDTGSPACPKHFAGNNTDENRGWMIAYMDEQTLRENYTKAFKIVVEEGDPACIMAAYNGVNGEFSSENHHLLTEILRDAWNWTGFVVSDWWATKEDGAKSLNAGLDLEMPDKRAFEDLPQALTGGQVDLAAIEQAAARILNVQARFGQLTTAWNNQAPNPGIVNDATHMALAYETSLKGQVLLKNDGILPLGADVGSILLMGPDADAERLGDRGSSDNLPVYAVTVQDGLEELAGELGFSVSHSDNPADAAGAGVVIIPVAMQHEDEGEAYGGGGDRDDLTLSGPHPLHWPQTPSSLINAAAAVNPNVIVLLNVGSAIVQTDWENSARGIVQTWYPGQEGGRVTAALLFGRENYSGKLPFTVATDPADYPYFGNTDSEATFDYLHGYRLFESAGIAPRYWFGHGLSYAQYDYDNLQVLCTDGIAQSGALNVSVNVTNSGSMAGDEVVMAFVGGFPAGPRRPPKELVSFTRVHLEPGASQEVFLQVPARDMAYFDETANAWITQTGAHTIFVGPNADPAQLLSAPFTIN